MRSSDREKGTARAVSLQIELGCALEDALCCSGVNSVCCQAMSDVIAGTNAALLSMIHISRQSLQRQRQPIAISATHHIRSKNEGGGGKGRGTRFTKTENQYRNKRKRGSEIPIRAKGSKDENQSKDLVFDLKLSALWGRGELHCYIVTVTCDRIVTFCEWPWYNPHHCAISTAILC
jgi:hypothetical protein